MKTIILSIAVIFCCIYICSGITKWSDHPPIVLPKKNTNSTEVIPCATTEIYNWKLRQRGLPAKPTASCPVQGKCDVPATRNSASSNLVTLNLIIHVFADANGAGPSGITADLVKQALTTTAMDFQSYNIDMKVNNIIFHRAPEFFCIPGYSDRDPSWYYAIEDMKAATAEDPAHNINMFVACMKPGLYGTLLGMATFPWDSDVLKAGGGIWLNSVIFTKNYQQVNDKTITHELGHNFGLWHTFHGVSEIEGCNDPCREPAGHPIIDPAADLVGDFCADTQSTPLNFYCRPPTQKDCKGQSFGNTNYNNFMGYSQSPKPCTTTFTDCQDMRMHCWACDVLTTQFASGKC